MKKSWMHWMVAAALVAVGGVAFAMTETMTIEIEKHNADEVTVGLNGRTETIALADLADGEERVLTEGDHTVIVRRQGDELVVKLDGEELGDKGAAANMVWVTTSEDETWTVEDGEKVRKKVVVITGEGDQAEGHAMAYSIHCDVDTDEEGEQVQRFVMRHGDGHDVDIEELESIDVHVGGHNMVFVGEDGHVQMVGPSAGDTVRYRCEEDGSELVVDKDKATEDSYVDPATGCVMYRVEDPEVRVMTIVKKKCTDEDHPEE